MNELNRLRLMPSHLISHHGNAFLITDLGGFVGGGIEGFYYQQTRFLSKLRFSVDGRTPSVVCANSVDSRSSIAYYLAPSPAGRQAGPRPDDEQADGGEIVEHAIEMQINSFLDGHLHQDVYLTNHGLAPATIMLGCELDADFADRDEAEQGERQQNAAVERRWQNGEGRGQLNFCYCHPQLPHATEIVLSGPGTLSEQSGTLCCVLNLPPQRAVGLAIEVVPVFLGERVAPRSRYGDAASTAATQGEGVRLTARSDQVQGAWDRAVSDLESLALLEGDGVEQRTPAAGVPKYVALFGRDALMAALQASVAEPAMLRGTLRLVSKWNATKYDERFDEEPGRVIHQRQLSPLALLEKKPFRHYYGDYSAPGLFLIGAAWDLALTGDREFFRSMRDKVLQTLEWMDRDGDRDGDGLYEYATKAGDWGVKNQGWKDSDDAILHEDGRMVQDPIAVIEVQGCYYAAKQAIALAFAATGDAGKADELLAEAARLKRRVNDTFWMPDEQYFGLALDHDKNLVRTIAADAGQCLAYGIVDDDKAAAVAERLMMPDLFSGWGVRTLSSRHPAFNPFAYHLGSVWPTANAIIGLGLKRYGFNAQLHRLAEGMFDASRLFDYDRLPEVFGGHPRDRLHPHPGIYPDACSPQAWSGSAVVSLVHSMLGLLPLAPRETLIIEPDLPEWLPELSLANIRLGKARIGLHFQRDASGYTHHEIIDQQGPVRVYRAPARPSGADNFARLVGDVVSA